MEVIVASGETRFWPVNWFVTISCWSDWVGVVRRCCGHNTGTGALIWDQGMMTWWGSEILWFKRKYFNEYPRISVSVSIVLAVKIYIIPGIWIVFPDQGCLSDRIIFVEILDWINIISLDGSSSGSCHTDCGHRTHYERVLLHVVRVGVLRILVSMLGRDGVEER